MLKKTRSGTKARARARAHPGAYHHGNLRDEALEAALRILGENGVAAVGVRSVAIAVGVSPMALYNHFDNKQALLSALAESGFDALGAALRRAAPSNRPPLERLRRGAIEYIAFAVENRALFELMFGGLRGSLAGEGPLRRAAASAFSVLVTCIADCSRAGLLNVDPIAAERAVWSSAHGYASLWNSVPELMRGERSQIRDNADHMLTALLRGLGY